MSNIVCKKKLKEEIDTLMHFDSNIYRNGIEEDSMICIKCLNEQTQMSRQILAFLFLLLLTSISLNQNSSYGVLF